ncbi:MerR family transcriptional regulator [Spirillospora sp. CA-142024]|uniref:MerR family transcriptional regulator n=1 Tax=Spirillospora sp. CA-142024 TaxID=3240036 RepID=UPI003D94E991
MEDAAGGGAGLDLDAVARRLGLAASTVRAWDRRYGIGPTGRGPGGRRHYTPDDLARLEAMRQLVSAGAPPAEAAEAALDAPSGRLPVPSGHDAGADRIAVDASAAGREAPQAAQARDLERAAMALDEFTMTGIVQAALRQEGVTAAWDQVMAPVLTWIGRKHATSGRYVEVEHLLSAVLSRCLVTAAPSEAAYPDRRGRGPVLLACAPEEQHCLPVLALAAALTEAGATRLMLGARVPVPALAAAIDRAGAHTVFVWSQTAETGDPSWLTSLPARRSPPRMVVGGPGWDRDRLPREVSFATSLSGALEALRVVAPQR